MTLIGRLLLPRRHWILIPVSVMRLNTLLPVPMLSISMKAKWLVLCRPSDYSKTLKHGPVASIIDFREPIITIKGNEPEAQAEKIM